MSKGFTFVEMVVVVIVVGIAAGIAVPRLSGALDRMAVRRSVNEARVFYQAARMEAVLRGRWVEISWRSDSLIAKFERSSDSVFLAIAGPTARRVELTSSRPVIRIQPTGLGSGAANTKLVFHRGTASDSLATSRLGRLRLIR